MKAVLAWLFVLSPEGRLFFWVTALLHIALKVFLGLGAVFEDHYGFRSLMAPPQSIVLAAGDIGVCFLFARLLDWALPAARRRATYVGLLWFMVAFLGANFIVHSYFKAFVNRGLLAFNGAPISEIVDYAIAGANRYAVTFLVLSFACVTAVTAFHNRLLRSYFVKKRWLPVIVLSLNVGSMAYISQLNQGQVAFMAVNPGYALFMSYLSLNKDVIRRATPEEARHFADPTPIFGTYDNALSAPSIRRARSNVLFVLIESLPLEQTPLGGTPGGLTILEELAGDAISFTNFRTVFPATSRSMLTYLCGIYPGAGLSTATRYMPDYQCESLLKPLAAAGYRTGFFTAPMFNYDNLGKSAVMKKFDVYEDFLTLRQRIPDAEIDAPAVPEEIVVDALMDFLTTERGRPFFATYFMFWNHAPYRLPFEDISHLPPLERYRRTLSYLDKALREALSRMKREGLLENTVVIVTADHGEGFGLHHGNVNHSGHIYEDDVKVPFLIHIPGLGRHVTARQASNVDFAPTLSTLLELPRPTSWQGQDLLSETFTPRPTLLFGRASFATNGLVDGSYKYIEYLDGSSTALYDLSSDPLEQQNLIEQLPQNAERYRSLIHSWLPVVEERSWAVHGR